MVPAVITDVVVVVIVVVVIVVVLCIVVVVIWLNREGTCEIYALIVQFLQ